MKSSKKHQLLTWLLYIAITCAFVLLTILMPTDMADTTNALSLLTCVAVILISLYLIEFTTLGDS